MMLVNEDYENIMNDEWRLWKWVECMKTIHYICIMVCKMKVFQRSHLSLLTIKKMQFFSRSRQPQLSDKHCSSTAADEGSTTFTIFLLGNAIVQHYEIVLSQHFSVSQEFHGLIYFLFTNWSTFSKTASTVIRWVGKSIWTIQSMMTESITQGDLSFWITILYAMPHVSVFTFSSKPRCRFRNYFWGGELDRVVIPGEGGGEGEDY